MIMDQLKNASFYYSLNEGLAKGLRYLQQTDLSRLEPGRYEVAGDHIFALIQESVTKPLEQGFWEAHHRHIDIHYVINGLEQIGYAPVDELKPGLYDGEKDLQVFDGQGTMMITARPGIFIVMFPQDGHMPGIALQAPGPFKKAVIKIRL